MHSKGNFLIIMKKMSNYVSTVLYYEKARMQSMIFSQIIIPKKGCIKIKIKKIKDVINIFSILSHLAQSVSTFFIK